MKTKTIVVMLMFLVSWIATNGSACACVQDAISEVSAISTKIQNGFRFLQTSVHSTSDSENCAECGHSGACCSALNSSAVSPAVFLPLMDLDQVLVTYEPEAGFIQIPDYVGPVTGTRAPPAVRQFTLVSAHQLLLN